MPWSLLELHSSLKSRIIMGIAIMLLPLCVLVMVAVLAVRGAVDTLDQVVYDPVEKLLFSNELQEYFHQLKSPVQQYITHPEESDRSQFDRLSVEVMLDFDNGLNNMHFTQAESDLLTTAKHDWINVHIIGVNLMNDVAKLNAEESRAQLFEFTRGVDRVLAMLNRVESLTQAEIQQQRMGTQEIKWKSIILVFVILGVGLIFALLGALLLFKLVISPIRNLEEKINRFGAGDLSSRIRYKSNDELGHLGSAFNAMAERFQKIQSELDYLSIHDSLTGLYDRSQLHELVSMEMQRAKRYKRPFSLVFIDITNFHQVNDTYGHMVGDSILCSVAMQISNTVRPTDVAARYGDDEFAVLLSETDAAGARETADRLSKAIAENSLNIGDGKRLNVEVCIGVATYPDDADNEAGIFVQADYALERAKKAVRTRPPLEKNIDK